MEEPLVPPPVAQREAALLARAYQINPAHLAIVAFVHDATTGEVLHTIFQRLTAPGVVSGRVQSTVSQTP